MRTESDYVVVGSGSAGSIVARRLAETGASVTLLEAGAVDKTWLVRRPGIIGPLYASPRLHRGLDWGHYSTPQHHAAGRVFPQLHGKVLGGSSSINAMAFVRGNPRNFDMWAREGNAGWSYSDVLPSFKRLESFEDGGSELRGGDGPIEVTRWRNPHAPAVLFSEALTGSIGLKPNPDYNGAVQEGVSPTQQNCSAGRRSSTATGYLREHLGTLRILTGAPVSRVVFEHGRAVGVELATGSDRSVVRAHREVVLCAGAFGSPHLLMLSGIGPADHLRATGIDVTADLPVGTNLHDHALVPVTMTLPSVRAAELPAYFDPAFIRNAVRGRARWLRQSLFEMVAFARTAYAGSVPDLQMQMISWGYDGYATSGAPPVSVPVLTVLVKTLYPRSRGTVRLRSDSIADGPIIDPNYLSEHHDVDVLTAGIEMVREAARTSPFASELGAEISPGPSVINRGDLAQHIRRHITTVNHPVGTCRMSTDERAVVDPQLRVLGVDGLRVADASIMPEIVGGNTNAATMMIGERAAELITS